MIKNSFLIFCLIFLLPTVGLAAWADRECVYQTPYPGTVAGGTGPTGKNVCNSAYAYDDTGTWDCVDYANIKFNEPWEIINGPLYIFYYDGLLQDWVGVSFYMINFLQKPGGGNLPASWNALYDDVPLGTSVTDMRTMYPNGCPPVCDSIDDNDSDCVANHCDAYPDDGQLGKYFYLYGYTQSLATGDRGAFVVSYLPPSQYGALSPSERAASSIMAGDVPTGVTRTYIGDFGKAGEMECTVCDGDPCEITWYPQSTGGPETDPVPLTGTDLDNSDPNAPTDIPGSDIIDESLIGDDPAASDPYLPGSDTTPDPVVADDDLAATSPGIYDEYSAEQLGKIAASSSDALDELRNLGGALKSGQDTTNSLLGEIARDGINVDLSSIENRLAPGHDEAGTGDGLFDTIKSSDTDTLQQSIDNNIAGIKTALQSVADNLSTHEPFATLMNLAGNLSFLVATPTAPVFVASFPLLGEISVDLSRWNTVASMIRGLLAVLGIISTTIYLINRWI